MNTSPIFSIVTPTLNHGRFIEETIKSVLSQEGDFYLDYIIVDGGSTDDSLKIIKKFDTLLKEGRYPVKCKGIEFRWVSEPDKGQSDAINKGFELAKGDILAWLNSDDKYVDSALLNVINGFQRCEDASVVYGDLNIINEKGERIGQFKGQPFQGMTKLIESCWNTSASFLVQPALFFKKDSLNKSGLLDTGLNALFDYDLFIRIASNDKFTYIDKTLSEFRIYPASKTGNMDVSYIYERVNVSKRYWSLLPLLERKQIKIDSERYLIRRLFLKIKQFFKQRDFFQLLRASCCLIKEIFRIFIDRDLRIKAVESLRKHKIRGSIN